VSICCLSVTEKGKTLMGHFRLPKGWWGSRRAGGEIPPPLSMVQKCPGPLYFPNSIRFDCDFFTVVLLFLFWPFFILCVFNICDYLRLCCFGAVVGEDINIYKVISCQTKWLRILPHPVHGNESTSNKQ